LGETRLRLIALASLIELFLLSFVGGLVSGLGQGFDLGIEWPSEPVRLIRAFLEGSLEPLHRILTLLAAPFLIVLLALTGIYRRIYPEAFYAAIFSIVLLTATAITGRLILLALGGYFEQPYASLIYSANNLLATLTIGSVAVALGLLSKRGWEIYQGERRAAMIAHRGAAAWGIIASFLGAYMLGYTKTSQASIPGTIFDIEAWSHIDAVLKAHALSGAFAVILSISAFALRRRRDAWAFAALASSIVQPLAGFSLLYRASQYTWAPGVYLPIHLILAQLIVVSNGAPYLAYFVYSRRRRQIL